MSAADGHHELSLDPKRYLQAIIANESSSFVALNVSSHRFQPYMVDDGIRKNDPSSYDVSSADTWFETAPVVLLFIVYFIVIVAGVFGNASLVLTICTQTSARFRNPLLVALCVADLMVTGVSAPMTILIMVMTEQRWSVTSLGCRAVLFVQVCNIETISI